MAERIFWSPLPVGRNEIKALVCLVKKHIWGVIEERTDELKVQFSEGKSGIWKSNYLRRECQRCGQIELGVSEMAKNPFGPRFVVSFGKAATEGQASTEGKAIGK